MIIAFILGLSLAREFDFKNLKFENNRLAIIYGATFIVAISLLIREYRSPAQNKTDKDKL